ncbi:uncharacterized protein KY384_006715 [Bacidia gigantensis]|uniref:uncharacterized protein n=1 Tax=Bacidia gigantensis TaxID=2732470 RepID=UPI001D03C3F6|nr:uncharacterized protein KY384_006715 [Bacidia gigantensis]KAG8529025.1 hypothetical protein KY384_006715 [Bacidia gigantensis]
MDPSWVKGTILVRCNSVIRGHSAVSWKVIETVNSLIRHQITPVVPLRGSVSASGDLSPLSYIAGTVTGNPEIKVQVRRGGRPTIVSSNDALQTAGIEPVTLGPREGLGLLNGTATSAAVGSLALFDAHNLTMLSQALTAMAVEALLGSYGSFHLFIARIRPHQGQIEVASNIRFLLQGSQLARGLNQDDSRSEGLFQDRYPLRTASQWIGPQLEDLLLSQKQVQTELNSTTDNPLIDVNNKHIHHSGNFQATSITSAMEKARLSLQMIGKLLFAQCSEIINPMLSNGLPPNLSADEPSLSFTCKGIDTSMASYMSELAFLANPVSSHVQSAEMHNQAVNSLALVSARYTLQSAEIVMLMAAAHLYVLCQALDLRARIVKFFLRLEPEMERLSASVWNEDLDAAEKMELDGKVWQRLVDGWSKETRLDSYRRAVIVADSCVSVVTIHFISSRTQLPQNFGEALARWRSEASTTVSDVYTENRQAFFHEQDTLQLLGTGSSTVYKFIRHELGVPFNQGLIEHPSPDSMSLGGREKKNIGSWISSIHDSLRDGRLYQAVLDIRRNDVIGETVPVAMKSVNGVDDKDPGRRQTSVISDAECRGLVGSVGKCEEL